MHHYTAPDRLLAQTLRSSRAQQLMAIPGWEPPMDGARCQLPGCDGVIEGGFCNRCGLEPATTPTPGVATVPFERPAPPAGSAAVGSSPSARSGSTPSRRSGSVRSSSRRALGLGLVAVPPVPQADPELAVLP